MRFLPATSSLQRGMAVMLIVVLLGGCMTMKSVRISPTAYKPDASSAELVGVTTVTGLEIPFTAPGEIREEVVYAEMTDFQATPSEFPLTAVDQLWLDERSFSAWKTLGLVPLALIVLAGLVAASGGFFPGSPLGDASTCC